MLVGGLNRPILRHGVIPRQLSGHDRVFLAFRITRDHGGLTITLPPAHGRAHRLKPVR